MSLDDNQINQIRSQFPIFEKKVYLNSCSQGALSRAVADGINEHISSWRDEGSPWEAWVERCEVLRKEFAALIGAQPEEVAITGSASTALNALASSLDFRERNRVVMGELEFPTMSYVWNAQRKRGAEVDFVKVVDNAVSESDYERKIDDKTKVVPLTHVSFLNGFRTNIGAVTEIAHRHGALVVVDDYQDAGTRPIDVKEMGVDCYVTGALKYLLGTSGLAFLYVKQELIESLEPTQSGWFAQENPFSFDLHEYKPARSAARFQNGSPPVSNAYTALPGIRLLREIGLDVVSEHIKELAQYLYKGCRDRGIVVKTPAETVGPLVVLQTKDVDKLIARLAENDIVVSGRHDGLRISFHVYNTTEDVDAVLSMLDQNIDLMVRD